MSKGSKPPPPPDPNAVANAQTGLNERSALYTAGLNRYTTNTPLGSQSYRITGTDPITGAPNYEQNVSLDPQLEARYRQQMGLDTGLADASGKVLSQINGQSPFSFGGLPDLPTDYEGLRKSQSDALYKRNTDYLDPQFKQTEDSLRSRLANQGIVEGSEAYTNAVGDFNRGKEFSYGQARDSAIAGGGAEADRAFDTQSRARQQMLSERLTGYQLPYEQLASLHGVTGGVNLPQFGQASDVGTSPADITNPIYQNYQGLIDAYNAKQGSRNATMGGLFSLGSAAIGTIKH
jgi:hypothetical protein